MAEFLRFKTKDRVKCVIRGRVVSVPKGDQGWYLVQTADGRIISVRQQELAFDLTKFGGTDER